jgi:hypothetical protein
MPLLRIGWIQTVAHYQNMFFAGQFIQQFAPLWGGQALAPSMHRWFQNGDHMMHPSPPLLYSIPEQIFPFLFGGIILVMSILVLRRLSHSPVPLILLFCWFGLLFSPGWQHYFCFLPLCTLMLWNKTEIKGKSTLVCATLIERIPILFLGSIEEVYYHSSAWGTTTISTLLILGVSLFGISCEKKVEDVQ